MVGLYEKLKKYGGAAIKKIGSKIWNGIKTAGPTVASWLGVPPKTVQQGLNAIEKIGGGVYNGIKSISNDRKKEGGKVNFGNFLKNTTKGFQKGFSVKDIDDDDDEDLIQLKKT
jgi:hypothetical protein